MSECPDCGSTDLFWDWHLTTRAPAGNLLHHLSEVGVNMYQGCNECSCTVRDMRLDDWLCVNGVPGPT